ncbi:MULTISPECIES: tyrosine-type recombinase/integrase [unclassified Tatumella]|uniref:tyrosine-type recombinase/integrase n=1 Tax=unclassified Tatumella TaxID=2649542 RepID=UPI001BAF4A0E|nr:MULTISPECIES: tyrosine-type recombinase/integrase [unclassified Tatumella]MBS0856269.1 tyrosine-type recombinase/integrase [Tatumella sp. JGM16]MBS0913422.1 tyrosine-type recombinase/integrase [Tatumella sp. JGM91]
MLTVKQIESAKPKDKPYRLLDSDGLYLYVPVSGKKVWQLRYQMLGKEKIMTLGKYPFLTLQDARVKSFEAKRALAAGDDPMASGRREKSDNSFDSIFEEWYGNKKQVWSEGYASELLGMFKDDILPMIGNMDINTIEPMDILSVIRRFESRGAHERANKARRRCGEVFKYAIVTGRAKYNPSPDLADAMRGYRKKNYPYLTADQIPGFNRALSSHTGSQVTISATRLLQYTAMRTLEMRSMRWSNVDFDNRMITIDAEFMKGRKVHFVPMSNQVFSLLKTLQPITESTGLVFPGRNDRAKPISEGAVLQVIKRIGYEGIASGHGFRHQFSTILHDNGWPTEVIEKQLAHSDGNAIRGIYNHAQYSEKRREMMQWWADWIDDCCGG